MINYVSINDLPKGYKARRRIPNLLAGRRDPMFDLCPKDAKVAVEIGTQWGWWPYRAAKNLPDSCKIYCIDPWRSDPFSLKHYHGGENNKYEWILNVRQWLGDKVFGIQSTSVFVANVLDVKVDFLFIDGDHREESVYSDLEAWFPKMAMGGVIVGHDWNGPWKKGVRRAVNSFFKPRPNEIYHSPLYWSVQGKEKSECWVWRC